MHEWALAEAVVAYVSELMKSRGGSIVRRLVVGLGALQSIDREVLEFAIKSVAEEEGIRIMELVFRDVPARLRCRRCFFEWSLDTQELPSEVREAIHFVPEVVHSYVKCPRCGSRDFDIVSGRGLSVEDVVIG